MRAFAITLILSLQALLPTHVSVTGYVVPDNYAPASQVVLVSEVAELYAPIKRDGTFEFVGVRPGTYNVVALSGGQWSDALRYGVPSQRLVVRAEHITGLRLVTPRRIEVRGTARLDGSRLMPTFSLSLSKDSAPYYSDRFDAGREIRFEVYPGAYRVTATGIPAGLFVRSITAGGADLRTEWLIVTENGARAVNVTLAINPTVQSPFVQVGGRLTGGDATAFAETRMTMAGPALVDVLESTVDADGRFHFPMVLPGTYKVDIASAPEIRGAQAISVGVGDFDLPNLQIPMEAWHEVTGRVVPEDAGTLPEFISFRLERPKNPTTRNATVSISSEILEKIPPPLRDPWRIIDRKTTRGLSAAWDGRAETIEGELGPGTVVAMPAEALGRNARLKPDGRFTVRLPAGEWKFGLGSTPLPGYVLSAATYGRRDILKDHLLVGRGNTAELVFTFKRQ